MNFKDGQFLTVEHLSPHMEKTSEGYLLCRDVPISRVGEFEYSGLEVGIPSKGGRVLMTRTADELFRPETIQSFNAKPVVIGHARFADPENWKDITVGIVQNVRRGQGEHADELLADLLLTDKKGIELVESGQLREVSCGYDASPVDDGDGKGHQVGIVGNHVALVEKARCGRACKIRDSEMKTTNLKTFLRRLFRDGDEEKFNEALDQVKIEELKDEDEDVITPPTDPTSSDDDRLAVLEHGTALYDAQRVFHAMGIDNAAVHVHGDDFCRKLNILVGVVHFAFAEEVGIAVLGKDERIVGLVGDGGIQPIVLLGGHGVLAQGVGSQCVVQSHRVLRSNTYGRLHRPHTPLCDGFSRKRQQDKQ